MTTMFDRYGGFGTVSKIVMAFYDKVLDSDEIGDYFEDVEMKNLIDHQTKFVASIMGGPASFTDEMLKRVHSRLGIDREDFDEVARLLRETLVDHGVNEIDVDTIMDAIEARSAVIISR